MNLQEYMSDKITLINAELGILLPPEDIEPRTVHRSMRYTTFLPGKRIRPVMMIALTEMFRGDIKKVLPAACAIEMVHSSSLILDDLPSMDDASMRRGKKANHLVFGEDMAILAGFGLLNLAFETAAKLPEKCGVPLKRAVEVSLQLGIAVGSMGLIGGQALDLESEGKKLDFEHLEFIHSRKTGTLFTAAGQIACILCGVSARDKMAVEQYTKNLGLAFQVVDDILDVTSTPDILGKDTAKDENKTTFVSFSSVEEAKEVASELIDFSVQALDKFAGRAEILKQLAYFVKERKI